MVRWLHPSRRAQERAPQDMTRNAFNETGTFGWLVMPGLVPGIHVFVSDGKKHVDGRDKPGHDEKAGRLAFSHSDLSMFQKIGVAGPSSTPDSDLRQALGPKYWPSGM
jgi:hypothetical protein